MPAAPSAPPALFITYGIGRGSRLVAAKEQDGILDAVIVTSLSRSRIRLDKGPA